MLKPLLLTFNLLCAGDAMTTHVVLARGGRELLLPVQNPWAADAIIAGQAASATVVMSKMGNKHPKATRVVLITLIAVRAIAVVHNARQG